MKKIKLGLFGKIVIVILCGVALGSVLPVFGVRILKTFNVFFAQVLKFIVPLLILGLVTPAIAGVGRGAGKMLIVVMLLSYLSTVLAAFRATAITASGSAPASCCRTMCSRGWWRRPETD